MKQRISPVLSLASLAVAAALLAILTFTVAPIAAGSRPATGAEVDTGSTKVLVGAASAKGPFSFGRDATPEEIAAWDIDVRPDGAGLPAGTGTVAQGAAIFEQKCSPCHGPTGKEGSFDVLVKPFEPGAPWPQLPRTIGNYWPYATTVYDFVNRAMPFSSPNSLEDDEVYALVAWLLNQNGIIPDDAEMNAQSLPAVEMPAKGFFRPEPAPSYRLK